MTKRELANKIAGKLDAIQAEFNAGKLTPMQWYNAVDDLFKQMQRESGYADGAFAQVWQAGCKEHDLRTFGMCAKTQF